MPSRLIAIIALPAFLLACGYAGETGDDYANSLAAKSQWSALQQAELALRDAPRKPFVYDADPAPDVSTIAFPAADGGGYVTFTAKAARGQILSMPEDRPFFADRRLIAGLLETGRISPPVAVELLRRGR